MAERVLVIRDQDLLNPEAPRRPRRRPVLIDRDGDALNTGSGDGQSGQGSVCQLRAGAVSGLPDRTGRDEARENTTLARLNASSVTYLNVAAVYQARAQFRPQRIGVVAIDGVPMKGNGSPGGHATEWRDSIVVSPGARVEFIMVGPPAGVPAMLVTKMVNTGPGGENDPNRPLISIAATPDAASTRSTLPAASGPLPAASCLGSGTSRRCAYAQVILLGGHPGSQDPAPEKFYLTVDGPDARHFRLRHPRHRISSSGKATWRTGSSRIAPPSCMPSISTRSISRWSSGSAWPVNEPYLRDTVNIPFYHLRAAKLSRPCDCAWISAIQHRRNVRLSLSPSGPRGWRHDGTHPRRAARPVRLERIITLFTRPSSRPE